MGATVIVAGRSEVKVQAVLDELRTATGHNEIYTAIGDLSHIAGIHALARQVTDRFSRLDVLLNNAGGIFNKRQLTEDRIEQTFALNHLSYFLLTHLLLDLLKASGAARIVNVSSDAHRPIQRFDFDNIQGEKRYIGFVAYGQSKLANVMFTYALARRLASSGVTANVLHPGAVSTGFGTNNKSLLDQIMFRGFQIFAMPVEQGAQTSIYLASAPEVDGVSGKYFVKSRPVPSSPASYDEKAQERLWEVSERLTLTKVMA
jgi:NAD(P)-dependent dehydrogenase (short-subunit alcohol dehydrogenase family)